LARLDIEQVLTLSGDKPFLEDRIILRNATNAPIALTEFEVGLQRQITDSIANLLPELAGDQLAAVPFRIRPTDPPGHSNDFSFGDLITKPGAEPRFTADQRYGQMPSRHRFSEGWLWTHGERALGLFKFNQENVEWSIVSTIVRDDGLWLRFGGACLLSGHPSALISIAPGRPVHLGVMRYQCVRANYNAGAHALRALLNEQGCRFPRDFNPPVHWNELYDNPEWWMTSPQGLTGRDVTRAQTYTRAAIEDEAIKAKAYGCEALYLDPGWDTAFGTFLWDEARLGSLRKFVEEMQTRHGLGVSLHCQLATWVSYPTCCAGSGGVASWPRVSWRKDEQGRVIENSICLGSRQYLDEAQKRLLDLCASGVVYLMFDGNWYNGGCWNADHGHPVPYRMEDHIRANVDLAQRIHAKFPRVLIEMHDMIGGGSRIRWTPVYYQYGLPGCYDSNWGFELMWNPFEDLRSGRGRALYYYNLGCNVPVYLHIDLRDDNEHCCMFWWFASTCRHLGVGGTHANPSIAQAQQHAMRRYRKLDRFFKRGEFRGISDEIHLHVLPEENAFVVNIFNLSDHPRIIEGSITLEELSVAPDRWYTRSERWGWFESDRFCVRCELPLWGTQLVEVRAL